MRTFFKQRRIVDRGAIDLYWLDHLHCEVCGRPGTVHHIKYVSAGGDDMPANFLTLCAEHHTNQYPLSFHTLGAEQFIVTHQKRHANDKGLGVQAIQKILAQYPEITLMHGPILLGGPPPNTRIPTIALPPGVKCPQPTFERLYECHPPKRESD